MNETAEWTALANHLLRVGHDIFATPPCRSLKSGYADEKYEKYIALALLARAMSNLKGALLLLDNRRMVEGRILTRCGVENSDWVAGLVTKGEAFVREMSHDEVSYRQQRGGRIFEAVHLSEMKSRRDCAPG